MFLKSYGISLLGQEASKGDWLSGHVFFVHREMAFSDRFPELTGRWKNCFSLRAI